MDEMTKIRSMAATFAHHDNNWIKMLVRALEEVERMRDERDEARRMVCALDADIMEDQMEYAARRGWDCFKNKQEEEDSDEQVHVD